MSNLPDTGDKIVVGVDDSDEALRAVRYAAYWADLNDQPLELLHAWVWPLYHVSLEPIPGIQDSGLRRAAELIVEDAAREARTVAPSVEITTRIETGRTTDVLLNASRDAGLLVVGNRGLGRFLSLLVGSAGLALATGAHCPVLVVRGEGNPDGPVVAAFDGTSSSEIAVRSGAIVAEKLGSRLRIVFANHDESAFLRDEDPLAYPDEVISRAERIAQEQSPNLDFYSDIVTGPTNTTALKEASQHSRMFVIAPHNRGELRGAFSSTSLAILQFANAPVLLARTLEQAEGDPED